MSEDSLSRLHKSLFLSSVVFIVYKKFDVIKETKSKVKSQNLVLLFKM